MADNLLNILVQKNVQIENKSQKKLITFLNPYSYLLAREHIDLFSKFDNIYIDGIALVKILKFFQLASVKRQSFDMTSLAPIIFNDAVKSSKSIYFIGTAPRVIDKAVENIQDSFPGLNIVGYRNGFIKPEEKAEVFKNIILARPDIVICGMGTPLQEEFLLNLQDLGWEGTGYTCGGFLHQTANDVQYYPHWIDKYNLRWVYRIYKEPKLFQRYFWEYPKFLVYFLFDYYFYTSKLK